MEWTILLCCDSLFLQFIVDCYATMEAWRLNYVKHHQGALRAYDGLQDAIIARENNPTTVGTRLVLPATFTRGGGYIRQHFINVMAICYQLGSSYFVCDIYLQS